MLPMTRKIRKLFRDPNRFFFDYFAKRLGANSSGLRDFSAEESVFPENAEVDYSIHPILQIARRFNLRTGAISGFSDQSILINSIDLFDVLSHARHVAYAFRSDLRIYTLDGRVKIDIPRESLWRMERAEKAFSLVRRHKEFVIEFLGEFENNFAAHVFLYDTDAEGLIVIRSDRAHVKKVIPESFNNIYPEIDGYFGNVKFSTPFPIDIVYTWVNRDDPKWIDLWNKQFPEKSIDNDRYASKDELKYSLRSLCKYVPWFRNVFIVSNCSMPTWMKLEKNVHWVDHSDIFPNDDCLPTFNSHAIESCLHRIRGLSEYFVYFNDDVFVTEPSYWHDFFDESGRSIAYLEPYGMVHDGNLFDSTREFLPPAINSQRILADFFPSSKALRLHKHTPHSLKKSVLEEIDKLIPERLAQTRAARIRSMEDINLTSFFYHHFALASGAAVKGDVSYLIVRPENIKKITDEKGIRGYKFLCFNDGGGSSENKRYLDAYNKILIKEFPKGSLFEIDRLDFVSDEQNGAAIGYNESAFPRVIENVSSRRTLRSPRGDAGPEKLNTKAAGCETPAR